jgi:hypothetical protein
MDVLTQMAEFEAAVQEAFQSAKEDIQQYWRDCGALPERVTSCAMAAKDMYCAQRDGNVWKHMLSYEAYRRRCALGALLNMRQEDKPTGPSSSP